MENEGRKIYGQNCFSLVSIQPGIKFVPLRTNGGEVIPESGLFVRIKKTGEDDEELREKAALATILEEETKMADVTRSLYKVPRSSAGDANGEGRRVTSPPILQSYKSGISSPGLSDDVVQMVVEEPQVTVSGAGEEVVLTVEIHPADGSPSNVTAM